MASALALAFAAGLVATVNPCGIAMLPAYLTWFVGADDADVDRRPLSTALRVGAVMSAGVVSVLVLAGLVISLGLRVLITIVPWLAIAIGIGLVVLGWRTLTDRPIPGLRTSTSGPADRSLRSVAVFGASYAVASLSCTLPVFLAVAAGSSVQTGVLRSIGTILAYGVGMSMLLLVLTIAVALGRTTLVRRVRASAGWLKMVSGWVAIAAGVVLVWYWAVNLALGNGAGAGSGAFPLVERASATLSNWLADRPGAVGTALAVVLLIAVVAVVVGRARTPRDEAAADHDQKTGPRAMDRASSG
ncbi:MAG: cytochrome c biogenesis CcdA family protein [Actinobacteria bacterium]|nr:cytochrome c biogenesis CcdA family protein [Actinomycetota bacterium]